MSTSMKQIEKSMNTQNASGIFNRSSTKETKMHSRVFSSLCLSIYVYLYLSRHYSARTGRAKSPIDLKGNLMDAGGCISHVYESSSRQTESVTQQTPFIFFSVLPMVYIRPYKMLGKLNSFCSRDPNALVHIRM